MAEINEIQVGQDVFNIGGSGGGVNYSTTEQDTGLKWTDGKPVYQIVRSCLGTNLTANQYTKIVDLSSFHIERCMIKGTVHNLENGQVLPIPYFDGTVIIVPQIYPDGYLAVYTTGYIYTANYIYEFVLEYTKTTD